MDLIIHHNIADLYKSLDLPYGEETDFTIHFKPDIIRQIPFKSPFYRADYFSFSFVKEGSGYYTLDEHRFPFSDGTVYFTNPGHIKSFEIEEMKDAYMITLTENFLRENVHPEIFDEFPFLLAEIVPPKVLPEKKFSEFEALYRQIYDESGKHSVYKNKILGNLFTVLLLKLKEEFWLDYDPIAEGNRTSRIVRSFRQLLESEFKNVMNREQNTGKLQVRSLAEKMNIHPNYLNSVIKSKTGRTVNDWISGQTLVAAKSLLTGTADSSKEIAYRLGFSEPTHFSRFFKKHTRLSPNTFRKLYRSQAGL